jgi:Alr-MurF fusion protein
VNLNLSIKELFSSLKLTPSETGIDETHIIQNVVVDSRSPRISASSLFIALAGNKNNGHDYLEDFVSKGGLIAIVSRKQNIKDLFEIVVEDCLGSLQILALNHRAKFNYPVIGITGSNGKTIVKEWLYHTLKDDFNIVRSPKSYNSQLGVALSVLGMSSHHNLAIFEAGISKPQEMQYLQEMIQPTIGVFTGLGDAHGANFDSNEQKRAEKFILFEKVSDVINAEVLEPVDSYLPFRDKASLANASTVYHTALKVGLKKEVILDKLSTLPAVSMRLEQLQGVNNCLLINDAYTADFAALEIALGHLNHIAGDRDKVLVLSLSKDQLHLTEEDAFRDLIGSVQLAKIVFIGEENVLQDAGVKCEYYTSIDSYLKEALVFNNSVVLFKGSRQNNLESLVHYYADKKHVTQLEISLSGMRHNLNLFRSELEKGVKALVMVKAQSYGTGLVEIAQFLQTESVDYLGVAYADEGVELRKAGIKLPILVMNPEKNAFDDIVEYKLEPSIYSMNSLQSFLHYLILKQLSGFPVHIKLDTGMNRLGIGPENLEELIETLNTQPEVYIKSVFSHLAVADDSQENNFTYEQIRQFEVMTGLMMQQTEYDFDRHLANSSGVLNYKSAHFDMVRIGIGIYGLLKDERPRLENVLTFTTEISQIKRLKEGDSLGYGRAFFAHEHTVIAVIPVGYADGLRRGLSKGNWYVIVNGKKAPIIGTICMDMCMINITEIEASVGDRVQIFGKENPIFEMAENLYTIPYEVISSISSRVHRVYLD